MKRLFVFMASSLLILSGCGNPSAKTEGEAGCCSANKNELQVVMNLHRKVKPECVSAFKASFEKCKESTMSEPGCLDYGMYQSYTDSTEFFIAETWKNKPEHMKHMETPHLKLHLEEIREMDAPSYQAKNVEVYVCPQIN